MKRAGIAVRNTIFDVKIAHYVLHPDMSHDLNRIALEYLNYKLAGNKVKEEQQLSLQFDEELPEENDFAENTNIIFQLYENCVMNFNRPVYLPFTTILKCLWYLYWQIWNTKE